MIHITPVRQRINFKMLLLVYKALNSFGLNYIADLLHYKQPLFLRSTGTGFLSVARIKSKHSEAAFSFYAPLIWN